MTAKRQPGSGGGAGQRPPAGEPDIAGGDRTADAGGPESAGPWGWGGGIDRDAPWGVEEDSPLDEGSEPTAVSEGRRGERRAAPSAAAAGRDGLGTVEPTRFPEAGPGAPPDPAPPRRTFPEDSAGGDLPDNPTEEQTGMHSEGVRRRGSG